MSDDRMSKRLFASVVLNKDIVIAWCRDIRRMAKRRPNRNAKAEAE